MTVVVEEEADGKWKLSKRPVGEMETSELAFLNKILEAAKPFFSAGKMLFQPGMELYYQKISGFLEKGFVVTLDYGSDAACQLTQKNGPGVRSISKKHDITYHGSLDESHPMFDGKMMGDLDVTTNINFSDLVLAGGNFCYYGKQENLGGHLEEFQILIQGAHIHPDCGKIAVEDLKKSSPIAYADMPTIIELQKSGRLLFDAIPSNAAAPKFEEALRAFSEWLHQNHYAENDSSYLGELDEDFAMFLLKSLINGFSDQKAGQNLYRILNKLSRNEKSVKILLTALTGFMAYFYYEIDPVITKLRASVLFSLKFLEDLCTKYYPESAKKIMDARDMSQYNLAFLFREKNSNSSFLDECLFSANREKNRQTCNPAKIEGSVFHHEPAPVVSSVVEESSSKGTAPNHSQTM